jgi:hypothetical protein
MEDKYQTAVGTVGVAVAAAVGVVLSSQLLLDETVGTAVESGLVSGVIAAVVFAFADYTRRVFR